MAHITLPTRNITPICIPQHQKMLTKIHSAHFKKGDATTTLCITFMDFIQITQKLMDHSRGVR
jgi:hypothetical protein